MNVKYYIKDVEDLIHPRRANETDAGYDVTATSDPKIVGTMSPDGHYYEILYVEYETNLYVCPDSTNGHFHTDLRPRSSISKYNLVLANSIGLIDRGYKNQVLCRFKYIAQPIDLMILGTFDVGPSGIVCKPNIDRMYKKGDKIAQILPILTHDITFEVVKDLPGEDRGGGFGSTDKKPEPRKTITSQIMGFKLGGKITTAQYLKQIPAIRLSVEQIERALRTYDGEVYEYTEYPKGAGLCVVDEVGQIMGKIELVSYQPDTNYRRG